jgi:hypothetical protein
VPFDLLDEESTMVKSNLQFTQRNYRHRLEAASLVLRSTSMTQGNPRHRKKKTWPSLLEQVHDGDQLQSTATYLEQDDPTG